MSILIKGIPLGGYEISIMKDGERYRARVDGIWCEVEEISTTEPDTDTISRQAVKEILDKYQLRYHIFPYVWDAINALPPAQPEPSQVAKDIARIVENGQDMRVIAQPEIIRCKDCKHWIPYDWMFSEVWQSKNIADYPEDEIGCNYCDMTMKANDFCSRGERRIDG